MAPDKLENCAQCCFNKLDCRLFLSKFSQFAICLSLSLSVISKRLTQPCCKCCNVSVSVVLNARFTTNGMCVRDDHGAGVDSGQSLHFRLEQEPESLFLVRAGAGVNIKVCAGANQNF